MRHPWDSHGKMGCEQTLEFLQERDRVAWGAFAVTQPWVWSDAMLKTAQAGFTFLGWVELQIVTAV